jgi:hypothetical protein
LVTDFENYSTFVPAPQHAATLATMLGQLESWTGALAEVRQQKLSAAA